MRTALALLALCLAGCASSGYGSTLLPTADAGEFPYQYRIEVPDGYEILSVDYDAALVGIASGENTSTKVSGRGVVTVYARERATGDEVVLVYDDLLARPTPTALIRVERSADGAQAERR